MRVIIPILITAIWTLSTVRIDGVWPPEQAMQSVSEIGHQIEVPARSLLATLSLDPQAEAPQGSLLQLRQLKDSSEEQRRIALPGLPKPPGNPVCS